MSFIYLSLFHLNRISQISIPKVSLSILPQLSSSLKHSHITVDLAAKRQQIGGSRLAAAATPLGFSCGFFVGFGFDFGLGWFFGGFELILGWVSQWVWNVFELGF